ncbi:anaerobic ribonucleoside-triphosphate reductase activating protein [Pyrococcus abyssi]|uniref:Anaerobic ribonucleotide triphosphate reductase activating enzyme n=1 Tax=Pyrococcus abyssi (strain GE5 / Orsay) TaxID=272844 RepID=Q9V2Q3_PYRAB|nr:anaerobic ribonucleoside-triphosphate reductase activating protein [Pyrococcus abyssi]CAB48945.1 Anaerobic ribonucleotide triphosphate reductase activating enzyme [Pyrococcus abyssi GE5]CCE69390.1 TPA: pyruvate formate-lyase activating enzyme related protein [Pyrococcus abyssi GE5]
MLTAGWKSISMVDVHGKVTFTIWLCGCNLKCPFCHNWRIADRLECHELNVNSLMEDLSQSSLFIDYFHITGGEPLVQWRELSDLLRKVEEIGVEVSLNTNLTIVRPLERLLSEGLVNHIATDLKVPPLELYGLPKNASNVLWKLYLKGLEIVSRHKIPLELRIPIPRGFNIEPWVKEVLPRIKTDYYVVLNPLVGRPLTNPRNEEWCNKHCWPRKEEISKIKEIIEEYGVNVYVSSFASS